MVTPKEDSAIKSARYVTIELAAKITGLSPGAIRKRIERGMWREGVEWRRGPDNRVWIDTQGVERWVEMQKRNRFEVE